MHRELRHRSLRATGLGGMRRLRSLTAGGGCTCDGARPAGTSDAATVRRRSTPRPTSAQTGHPIMRSFEPGESWFWNYESDAYAEGPDLAPPVARPEGQGSPAPRDACPPTGGACCTSRRGGSG